MSYQKIYSELKKKVLKDYGKKCKDFCLGCSVCEAYLALSFLESCVIIEKEEQKSKKKKQHANTKSKKG